MQEILVATIVGGIMIGGFYALFSMGFSLIYGVMNILQLSHGELIMLGMYSTFYLVTFFGIDLFVSIPLVFLIMFLVGMLMERTVFRPVIDKSRSVVAILTIGLILFLQNLAQLVFGSDYKGLQFPYSQVSIDFLFFKTNLLRLASFLAALLIMLVLYICILKTKWGKAIRACSQNPESAYLMGINVKKIRMMSFGIGTALAGVAGALLSSCFYIFPTVGGRFLSIMIATVVLGGMGSIRGSFVGGMVLGLSEALAGVYFSLAYREITAFVILIAVLLVKPEGLFGRRT